MTPSRGSSGAESPCPLDERHSCRWAARWRLGQDRQPEPVGISLNRMANPTLLPLHLQPVSVGGESEADGQGALEAVV